VRHDIVVPKVVRTDIILGRLPQIRAAESLSLKSGVTFSHLI
jgi:hypothetical protein